MLAQPMNATMELPAQLRELTDLVTGLSWQDWLWSLGVIVVAAIIGRLVGSLGFRLLRTWSKRTDTIIDDAVARHLGRPLKWVLPVFFVTVFMPTVSLPENVQEGLRHFVLVLTIFGVGWGLIAALRALEDVVKHRYDISKPDNLEARSVRTQVRAFRNIAAFVIGVLTVGFALMTFEAVRQLGTGLLASAGLAGIILGFAAQRSIATVVAGIQIAMAQPIRVDDVVIVEGEWGKIEEITLTYVVVKIWDLRRLIVPITYFLERPFQNWTRGSPALLGTVELQLDYSVPVDAIRKELDRILEASEHWDGQSKGVQVIAAGERSMTVRPLISAADAGKQWNLRCEVREKLIDFINREYPGALPRVRLESTDAPQQRRAG